MSHSTAPPAHSYPVRSVRAGDRMLLGDGTWITVARVEAGAFSCAVYPEVGPVRRFAWRISEPLVVIGRED